MEEEIKVLENCWVMTTDHVLDDGNIALKLAIKNFIKEYRQLEKENKELKKYKDRCEGAVEFINSRIDGMVPEHYEDLYYILCESEEGEW